ncbi:MAG: DUF883 domain-containing protein [Proteobacteria bacterium]|nr:DUF883 domain-containing protein [Pseudomonadota bacterium]
MSEAVDGGMAQEIKSLMSEAEALLRSNAGAASAQAQERVQATLRDLRDRLAGLESQLRDRARDVDDYVHDNPWQAVAVVGGLALLVGLVMGRR